MKATVHNIIMITIKNTFITNNVLYSNLDILSNNDIFEISICRRENIIAG